MIDYIRSAPDLPQAKATVPDRAVGSSVTLRLASPIASEGTRLLPGKIVSKNDDGSYMVDTGMGISIKAKEADFA
jgi:hypothetical protein